MSTQISPMAGMFAPGQFIVNKRKIISVYPNKCTSDSIRGAPIGRSGFTTFVLAAAPEGGYSELEVEDMVEYHQQPNEDSPRPTRVPLPKPADLIAFSLVREWTEGRVGSHSGGKPGIAVRDDSKSLDQQLDELRETQTIYFQTLVDEATGYHNNHEYKKILNEHRMAARQLKLDVPWLSGKKARATKKCLVCGEEILESALRCKECGADLVEFAMKYNLTGDAVVNAVIAGMNKQEKTTPPPVPQSAPQIPVPPVKK